MMLKSSGIEGICHTSYTVQERKSTNQLSVTKSKDLNNCEEKACMVTGNAFFHECNTCKQRNKNSRAAATYNYKVKATNSGGLVMEVDVREVHQFTPFNEIEGAVILEARRWILDAIPALANPLSLRFLKHRIDRKDLTEFETVQAVLLTLHLIKADYEVIIEAKCLVAMIKTQQDSLLRKVAFLSYGSLIQKICRTSELCSKGALQPINDLLWEAASEDHKNDMILALKALGNAGEPESVKQIRKFLPGISSSAKKLPISIQASAVIALKNIALRDPRKVQDICLTIYVKFNVHPTIRMIAAAVLLDSKPPAGLLISLANALLREANVEVASFIYSLMKTMSGSTAPDMREVAAACNIAITILKPKFGSLSNRYFKDIYYDLYKAQKEESEEEHYAIPHSDTSHEEPGEGTSWRSATPPPLSEYGLPPTTGPQWMLHGRWMPSTTADSFMSGITASFNMLNNAANIIPLAVMTRLKVHFMGIFADLFEIGFQAEGLQEILMNQHIFPRGSAPQNINKIMDMLKKLSEWKPLPTDDDPLASAYIKILGQEIFFYEFDKQELHNISQLFYRSRKKISNLQAIVSQLQNGVDQRWSKSLLSSEIHRVVPTCVGLPLKTSLHYSSVTRVGIQAQAHITPAPNQEVNIQQLLHSHINLTSRLSLSMTKDITLFMGTNTQLIQTGMEVQAKIHIFLPVNFAATIDVKQKNFKLDFIPSPHENEVVSIRSEAYTVTRNFEDLVKAKVIPVVPTEREPNVLKQSFNPRDLPAGGLLITEGKITAETLSKETLYSAKQRTQHPHPSYHSLCATASNFGFQMCLEKTSTSAAVIRNCPLYHTIGNHSVTVLFKPVHMDASVKKIQIEFQAGPRAATKMVHPANQKSERGGRESKNSMDIMPFSNLKKILSLEDYAMSKQTKENSKPESFNSSYESQDSSKWSSAHQNLASGRPMLPDFIIIARALMSDNKPRGYQTTVYIDTSKQYAQMIIMSLVKNSFWKACVDAAIAGNHNALAEVRWGQRCKDYRVSAKVSTGQLARNSAVQIALQWGKLPTWIKRAAQRIMRLVPGVAYMLGFSEKESKNPPHQLILQLTATSPKSIDAIVKAPELEGEKFSSTVCKNYFIESVIDSWNSLPAEVVETNTVKEFKNASECKVTDKMFITFDNVNLRCSLPSANCYTVLAQDCTKQLRFLIAMKTRGQGQGLSTFEINAKLGSSDIRIYPDTSSDEFNVLFNGMFLRNNTYINEKDSIQIQKNATMVTVNSPENGVEKISFSGETVKITIAQWMKGKTCGLCGNADGHIQNDMQKPNNEKATSCNSLVHSWTIPDDSCHGGCTLSRQFVMLENHLIEEQESACYSLEPVLQCVKGCNPTEKVPVKVAFYCLPKHSEMRLEDWQVNPKEMSEDFIKEVDLRNNPAKLQQDIDEWHVLHSFKAGFVSDYNGFNIIAVLRIDEMVNLPCFAYVLNLIVTQFTQILKPKDSHVLKC
ncbi:vitellogenin-1-like [Rhinophrynus dorsalis]